MVTIVRSADLADDALPGRLSADPFHEGAGAEHGLSVRVVKLERDSERRAHLHPHSAEVSYVVAGAGVFWTDGGHHRIGPGDVVLVPPGTPHATVPDPGQTVVLVCFFPHPDLTSNIQELTMRPRVRERIEPGFGWVPGRG